MRGKEKKRYDFCMYSLTIKRKQTDLSGFLKKTLPSATITECITQTHKPLCTTQRNNVINSFTKKCR